VRRDLNALATSADQLRRHARENPSTAGEEVYLTESVYKVVLQKSIPGQIRQLILDISNTSADQLRRHARENPSSGGEEVKHSNRAFSSIIKSLKHNENGKSAY